MTLRYEDVPRGRKKPWAIPVEVAVTQGSMADVLSQLGRPQEAMALYEESLRTIQALGDTRGVAVTQGSMADVLRQLGRPQEATGAV